MFNIVIGQGELETTDGYMRRAEIALSNARIIGDDMEAARKYATQWYNHVHPTLARGETWARRREKIENMARGALGCAQNIMKDGRAHYVDREGMLICATLMQDASAGPVGYYPATVLKSPTA
jgi:hypothetical protein